MVQNYGLGRGLSSLIPPKKNKINEPQKDLNYFGGPVNKIGTKKIKKEKSIEEVDINTIIVNPYQPRVTFNEVKLNELAESIKEYGIIQPIVVNKRNGEGKYEIIAGERRYQASKLAGLTKIPVIIKTVNNQQKLELAIVENIQRQSLNPIEEAKSYLQLMQEFKLSQEEIAKKLGKSRSFIANKIRLLNLPVEIQKALIEGKITEGHAKIILSIANPEKQRAFLKMILKNKLTVHQAENKSKEILVRTHKRNMPIDPQIKAWEENFSQKLGTKVKIKKTGQGGKIMIEYYATEDLDNILERIK
jgi:ParB family chromosome partitioning protein